MLLQTSLFIRAEVVNRRLCGRRAISFQAESGYYSCPLWQAEPLKTLCDNMAAIQHAPGTVLFRHCWSAPAADCISNPVLMARGSIPTQAHLKGSGCRCTVLL